MKKITGRDASISGYYGIWVGFLELQQPYCDHTRWRGRELCCHANKGIEKAGEELKALTSGCPHLQMLLL